MTLLAWMRNRSNSHFFLSLGFHLHIRFISSSFPLAFTPSSQVVFFLYFLFFPLLLGYDFMVQAGQ